MKLLRSENLPAFFRKAAEKMTVYLPVENRVGKAEYEKWREGAEYSRKTNTERSAKDFFFPQTETLADFRTEGGTLTVLDTREECEDFLVFGVRACDAAALRVLDRVFLAPPKDTYYENRRRHGVIVSVACAHPAETCFCASFGVDAAAPDGDVAAYDLGWAFALDARTAKGEELLSLVSDILEDGGENEVRAQKEATRAILEKLPLAGLSCEGFGKGKTAALFDDPAWETLSAACLGCGSCTFHCPTCQCYDIRDFDTGHGVRRYRCWDSCMYRDFTEMSAGQPRPTQKERFRQRFLHKLVYFPDNAEGTFGCVGCGRCLEKCPQHLHIVKVMKTLGGKKK